MSALFLPGITPWYVVCSLSSASTERERPRSLHLQAFLTRSRPGLQIAEGEKEGSGTTSSEWLLALSAISNKIISSFQRLLLRVRCVVVPNFGWYTTQFYTRRSTGVSSTLRCAILCRYCANFLKAEVAIRRWNSCGHGSQDPKRVQKS